MPADSARHDESSDSLPAVSGATSAERPDEPRDLTHPGGGSLRGGTLDLTAATAATAAPDPAPSPDPSNATKTDNLAD